MSVTRTRTPLVTVYGHRLQDPTATGISRYGRELLAAMASAPPTDLRIEMASSPEPPGPEGLPAALPHRSPPGPRRALHLGWAAGHVPRVDRWVGRPDLIHVLYPSSPVPSRAKLVYTLHDLMPLRHPEWFGRVERWSFERAVRHAVARADALIADSVAVAGEAQQLLGLAPDRVTVVHLGVSPSFGAPAAPEQVAATAARYGVRPGSYLVALGTVSTRKNLTAVIRGIAGISPADRVPLLAVGPDGEGADAVRTVVRDCGLADLVRFTGWLPSQDVALLLSGALALVHPSLDEGFGMTPLEAMAVGVPALVSSSGSLPEVVGDAALITPSNDADGWGRCIGEISGDATLRARLVASGRVHAARFTWARTAAQTQDVYRKVLGLPPSGLDGI